MVTFNPDLSVSKDASIPIIHGYESIVVNRHPEAYGKLAKYRALIQNCDRRYLWHAVYAYDIRFWASCGVNKFFDFDHTDVTLYTTVLDATAIKASGRQCARCRSYDHQVRECPFPEETSMVLASMADKKSRTHTKDKWFHDNTEGCNNYQYGRCYFAGCKRAHVCRKCHGPEPSYKYKCE